MGTFDVELSPETVEASLLTAQGGGRRSRRLLLERLVHPLVAAILLGVAGFDELGGDAQADPPNGEAAQSADGRRRKGTPLSERMMVGRPYFSNRRRTTVFVPSWPVERSPWHPRINREQPSVTVSG